MAERSDLSKRDGPALASVPVHLSDEDFAAYASGLLTEEEKDAIDRHLVICEACLEEMENWMEAVAEWSTPEGERRLEMLRNLLLGLVDESVRTQAVAAALEHDAPHIRRAALDMLAQFGSSVTTPDILAKLGRALEDADESVRSAAGAAFEKMREAMDFLVLVTVPVPVRVRAAAAEPVERETPDGALRALVERLEDGALVVRVASVRPEYAGTPVAVRLGDWTSPPRPLEPAGPNAAGEEQYGARFEVPKDVAEGASAEELEIVRLAAGKQQG